MFRRSGKKGNYAYTVARVKAKKSLLMSEEDYSKMLMMSLPEISRFISETGYQKEMAELAGRIEGIDLVEHATYRNMSRIFTSILQASEGELYDMVAGYLNKWDNWNLKVVLRGKSYGVDNESIREDLVPAGRLDIEDLEKLIAIDSAEEIIAAYEKMASVSIPAEAVSAYKETGSLSSIEDYLDKFYYTRFLESIDPDSVPKRLFQDYVRKEIDIKNLETILKLKVEGIYGEDVLKYIIPGGKQIDRKLATQLANAESISAAVNDLSQLDFYEDIKEALEAAETKSLRGIVAGMQKYEMKEAKKFSHSSPLSVIPVVDYMIHKENEVSNIRAIARGIESGLDKDIIKGLLVI
jgi:V/A-type H+/Na+-transporting ATPase subunit C